MLLFIFQIHLLEKNVFFQILSSALSYNIYISLDSTEKNIVKKCNKIHCELKAIHHVEY